MALSERATGEDRAADRDPLLDRAYAGVARAEPPQSLDEAIRAAARREVGSRPRSLKSALHAWRIPVSLAAVVVLSVSVVLLMREEGADQSDMRPFAPAPELPAKQAGQRTKEEDRARRDTAVPAAEAPAGERSSARNAQPTETARREPAASAPATPSAPALPPKTGEGADQAKAPTPAEPAPAAAQPDRLTRQATPFPEAKEDREAASADKLVSPAGAAAKRAESEAAAGAAEARAPNAAPEAAARLRAAPAPPAAKPAVRAPSADVGALAARQPVWAGFEKLPAERWIERIEELQRAGRLAEAREMLEELKRRFPEYPVPASLAP